jgi:hypothetical protein
MSTGFGSMLPMASGAVTTGRSVFETREPVKGSGIARDPIVMMPRGTAQKTQIQINNAMTSGNKTFYTIGGALVLAIVAVVAINAVMTDVTTMMTIGAGVAGAVAGAGIGHAVGGAVSHATQRV